MIYLTSSSSTHPKLKRSRLGWPQHAMQTIHLYHPTQGAAGNKRDVTSPFPVCAVQQLALVRRRSHSEGKWDRGKD